MMRGALILAAAFVVAPVSYTPLLILFVPLIFDFAWFFLESMAKVQFWSLVVLSPIIVATKAYEALKRFI